MKEEEYDFFLVAKEFGRDVDTVMRWPLQKFFRHRIFLKEYYENQVFSEKRGQSKPRPVSKHAVQFR